MRRRRLEVCGIGPECTGVLEACQRRHLGQRVIQLANVCQRIDRPKFRHRLALHVANLREHRHARLIRTTAQRDINHHIHSAVPATRIKLHKLVCQAHHAGVVLMLHDKAQQALEQILHACLGKEAGDDFNVLLGCGHNGVDTSCCRVGQRIRVKTLRGCRDARAAFLDGIHILQDREGGLAHEGHCEGRHSALAALADDGTRFGVHHILDAHLALHDRHTRVD